MELEGRKPLVPSKGYIKAFELYQTSRCRNCGRVLHGEESQKRGFGPGCAIHFAARFIDRNPKFLGEGAKKVWTEEEIRKLIDFATSRRGK